MSWSEEAIRGERATANAVREPTSLERLTP
jgi:hypothetical protein